MATAYTTMPSAPYSDSRWGQLSNENYDPNYNASHMPDYSLDTLDRSGKNAVYTNHFDPGLERKPSLGRGLQNQAPAEAEDGDGEQTGGSAWIHRDKLAQIESREMAEAGFRMRRPSQRSLRSKSRNPSRSASQSSKRRAASRDRHAHGGASDEEGNAVPLPDREEQERAIVSHAAAHNEDESMGGEVQAFEGAGRPTQQYTRQMIRPPTSRIPVSRNSPVPVSHAVMERDSPLPRNRNGSNAWSASGEDRSYQDRRRSQSLGGSTAFEEPARARTPTSSRPLSSHLQNSPKMYSSSPTSSPGRSRTPGAQPSSRKFTPQTRVVSGPHQRNASGTQRDSLNGRPLSITRPPTAINRPEGDAPWLAEMYKPDPMLPPEQQMLPTVAKRLAQQQREKEGYSNGHGNDYSNDYSNTYNNNNAYSNDPPIERSDSMQDRAIAELPATPASPPQPVRMPSNKTDTLQPSWPLEDRRPSEASRRGSSKSGGYRITPKVPVQIPQIAPPAPPRSRMPVVDEKDAAAKSKGCGCCVVM